MKIVLGSDHAGVHLKSIIEKHLNELNHTVIDLGPYTSESYDYPDSAHKVAEYVLENKDALGILICGTGIGMSMAANRHEGIRAALCTSEFQARATKAHNNANILCLGSRVTGEGLALAIVDIFIQNEFEGGRHLRRIEKIELN